MSLFLLFNPISDAVAFGVAGSGQAGSVSIPGSIAVSLYSDNAGVPGTFVAFLGAFPDTSIPSGDSLLHITLPTPLALPAGRYWIQLSGNQLSGVRWIQAGDDSGSGVATETWYKTSSGTITSGANVAGPSYQMDVYGDQGFGSVAGTGLAGSIGINEFISGVGASGSVGTVSETAAGAPAGASGVGLADGQPSLDLSFMAQTLDSRISFSRNLSTATYFDSSGTLQTAAANAPRFDYDPLALTYRGLLMETGRTNSIRNNTMVGAVAGSPGTLATNWGANLGGLTQTIVGTGTESGISYIDVRYNGTTTGIAFDLQFEGNSNIAASNGQTWSMSAYIKLVAGSLANISSQTLVQQYYDSGVSFLNAATQAFTPTSSSLVSQRSQFVATIAVANTASIKPYIKFNCSIGVAIDITIRVGAPQLENGTGVTSPILTSGSALTRGTDNASMPTRDWYNQSTGTMVVEAIDEVSSGNEFLATFNDTTNLNEIRIFVAGTSLDTGILSSNTLYYHYNSNSPNVQYGVVNRGAIAWTTSTASTVLNGTVFNTASVTGPLPTITNLQIGSRTSNVFTANAWLREIRYWPLALSNTDLVYATSGLAVSEPFDSIVATITGVAGTGSATSLGGGTFTRASTATYVDASGILQTAANDVMRTDFSTGSGLVLLEAAGTNYIRNPRAEGSTNGAIGSGGVMPTNWVSTPAGGLTHTIVGTGTINGFPYIDIQVSGTNSTQFGNWKLDGNTAIVTATGDRWMTSAYVALVGGSWTNIGVRGLAAYWCDSVGNNSFGNTTFNFTPTATLTRYSGFLASATPASAVRMMPAFFYNVTSASGNAVNFTVRISCPQYEQNVAAVSSVMLPTAGSPGTSTRAADSGGSAGIEIISKTATGVAGTGAAGTLTAQDSATIAGATGTGSVGTATASVAITSPSVVATTAVSSATPQIASVITGVSATAELGTVTANTGINANVSLTGVAGTSQIGSVTPQVGGNVAGVSAASGVGSVSTRVDDTVTLTGASATGQTGTPLASLSVSELGVVGTGQVGSTSAQVSGTIAGCSGTSQVGTLSTSLSVAITGVSGTSAVGGLIANVVGVITGVSGTGQVQAPTDQITAVPTSAAATGAAGSLTVSEPATLTGLAGSGQAGTTRVQVAPSITGASGTGQVGLRNFLPPSTAWFLIGLTADYVAGGAPDGGFALRLTEDTSTGQHYLYTNNSTLHTDWIITYSFEVSGPRRYVQLYLQDALTGIDSASSGVLDLVTGSFISDTVATGAAIVSARSVQNISSGWYQVSITATLNSTDNGGGIQFRLQLMNGTLDNYTGNPANLLLCYAAYATGASVSALIPSDTITLSNAAGIGSVGTIAGQFSSTISGVTTAGISGITRVQISVPPSGVSATGQAGTETAQISGTLTGVSATSAAGTARTKIDIAINGASGTGQVGSISGQAAGVITGNAANGAAGSVTTEIDKAITGASGTGQAGSTVDRVSGTIAGTSASGVIGTLSAQIAITLSSVLATGGTGTVAKEVDVTTAGVASIGQVGSLTPREAGTITGTSASSGVGSVTAEVAHAVAGVAATGQAGVARIKIDVALANASATGGSGDLRSELDHAIAGVAAMAQIGAIARQITDSVLGVFCTGLVDQLLADVEAQLSGNLGIGEVGAVTFEIDESPSIAGVSAIGEAGDTSLPAVSIYPSNPLYDNIANLDTLGAVSLANNIIAASFSTGQAGGNLTTVRILLQALGEGFGLEGDPPAMIKLEDEGGVLVLEED